MLIIHKSSSMDIDNPLSPTTPTPSTSPPSNSKKSHHQPIIIQVIDLIIGHSYQITDSTSMEESINIINKWNNYFGHLISKMEIGLH